MAAQIENTITLYFKQKTVQNIKIPEHLTQSKTVPCTPESKSK
jgi:hypothetical protein